MNENNKLELSTIQKVLIVVIVVFCLITIYNMSRTMATMQQELSALRQEFNNLHSSISSEIGGISANIETSLKKENSIVADYSYQIQADKINRADKTVPLSLMVRPKEDKTGLKATFILETEDGNLITAPAEKAEANTYRTEAAVPLGNYMKLSVSFDDGTVQRSEKLEDMYQPFESYIMKVDSMSSLTVKNSPLDQSKRKLEFGGTIDTTITTSVDGSNYPVSGEVQILKNESLVKKLPIRIGEDTPSDPIGGNGAPAPASAVAAAVLAGSCTTYYTELKETITLKGNDALNIVVLVKDNLGFSYKQTVYGERSDKDGNSIPTNYSGEVVIE